MSGIIGFINIGDGATCCLFGKYLIIHVYKHFCEVVCGGLISSVSVLAFAEVIKDKTTMHRRREREQREANNDNTRTH